MELKKYFLFTIVFLLLVLHTPALAASTTTLPVQTKEVALTFDDGPYGTSTQEILTILKKEQVPATFFVIGKNVQKYPALTKEIVQDGNEIGNHTYTHPLLSKDATSTALAEIAQTESIIASTTGITTHLFRPPYGVLPASLKASLMKDGYTIAMWNVDPTDWNDKTSPSAKIVKRILAQKKSHMIVILHDGRDTHINYSRANTVQALPTIIEDLKKQGYTFVKVDALLASTTVKTALK